MNDLLTFEHIIEVLRLFASTFNVQKNAMPGGIVLADEIALLFDDIWQHSIFLLNRNVITTEQMEDLRYINHELEQMSEQKDLWTEESLCSNKKWDSIRKQSMNILKKWGKEYSIPHIDWIKFE
jgi:hypothetical protein